MSLPANLPLNLPLNFISATKEYCSFEKPVPAPYMRKSFILPEKAEKADLVICGLGFYELYINGKRITKGYLAPYITNPDDVLFYDQYEIHDLLDEGENVIGVMLGNGMQNSFGGAVWDFHTARWRSAPKLSLLLEIKTASGNTVAVPSDGSFKTAPSPIYMDDLRCGEFYDANKEISGWNMPGFDDAGWDNAIPAADIPRGEQVVCRAEPIVAAYELKPVSVTRSSITAKSTPHKKLREQNPQGISLPEDEYCNEGWLYDFGINIAGLCRLKIKGSKGQKVIMQFGDTLRDGGLDLSSMSFEPEGFNHRDIYICRGGEDEEIYMPSFTYHGFRYCLCMGITEEQAVPELLTCVVMNSDLKQRGGFECSDETANLLYKAAIRSDLANFYYFPTDCPHREKNGWTGDAAVSAEQMLVSLTAENSMREWLRCIRKAQDDRGALPGIVPTSGWGFAWGNGPAWDAALTYLPYYIWVYRGDREVLAENATSIMRYVNYIHTRIDKGDGLVRIGLGDWCHVGRGGSNHKSPVEFTDTVISMDICMKASEIFDVLGMAPQAAFARSVYGMLRKAARQKLLNLNTMEAAGNCQTSQAMAIYYNVFEPAEKQQAFALLLKMIGQCDGHFDCGMLGMRVIFHVLSDFGRSGLAYKMITRPDYPSYGNWIARGATTLWESFTPEGKSCGSRNHHFFGDISSWFIRCITGIQLNPYGNNVNEVNIKPSFIPELQYANGCHTAPAGEIKVSWKREAATSIVLDVAVPQGMKGRIILEDGCEFADGRSVKAAATGKYIVIAKTENKCKP